MSWSDQIKRLSLYLKQDVSVKFTTGVTKFLVTTETNCRASSCSIKLSCVLSHRGASSLLFQCIMSIFRPLIIGLIQCGYEKCSILYKGDDLRFNIRACNSTSALSHLSITRRTTRGTVTHNEIYPWFLDGCCTNINYFRTLCRGYFNVGTVSICVNSETTARVFIVTYIPIARQRLGKHIPSEAYVRNNRTSNARQRISKLTLSTI
jgi:hypothetical protein